MLLFIEHDAVMSTPEARKALADFVGHRHGINLAVFHAAVESDDDVLAAYPAALRERLLLTPKTPRARDLRFWLAYEAGCVWAALRERLLLTPKTPRARDLRFWLAYEAGCVWAALRSNGQLTQCEAWVTLVPPAWEKAARSQFGDKRVVVIPAAFSAADAKRLARTLSTYRRVPVAPESSMRNLASSASAVPMASSSAAVKTGSRGRSAGHSIRAASSAKRSASSASILG